MLLRQLVNYRRSIASDPSPEQPYSRDRMVRWQLDLDNDGTFRTLTDLADPSNRATKTGRSATVPNASRTVGVAPALGVDDVQYVLGWCDDKSKPERVAAAHAAFIALCRRWAGEHPDDTMAAAVVAFYDGAGPASVPPPDKWGSKDTVEIAVRGKKVTNSRNLWTLWQRVVEERKSSGDGRIGLCLVCGQPGTLLNRMPQALPKALVPRAEQEVALVSANKPIHTYDYREGLGTAPICLGCGQAAVANLTTILGDKDHTFRPDRQRSRTAWWVTNGGDEQTIALLDDDPEVIAAYFRRLDTDAKPDPLPQAELCSVTVSGNVARLVVHDWIEQPLAQAEANVRQWFDDHRIVDRGPDGYRWFPIGRLLLCAGQWIPDPADPNHRRGRYIPLFDKSADRPDDLAHLLRHAALSGSYLPPYLLAHVVRRIRIDGRIDEARAALLRVALTRYPNSTVKAPMARLEPENPTPAYVAGRLFATLEATQRAAFRGDELPNSTFFSRYFAGAISNPRVVIVQGHQLGAAWLKKIESSAERSSGAERDKRRAAAAALKQKLHDLFELLDVTPLPGRITTEEQSLFITGYHHQRAHDIAQGRAGKAPEDPGQSESSTDPTED